MFSARIVCIASLCLAAPGAHALGAGDIAFTAFNADEDGWAIVALTDLAAGSTVYFSDSNWNGSSFGSAEGMHTWSTGASVITASEISAMSGAAVTTPSPVTEMRAGSSAKAGLASARETARSGARGRRIRCPFSCAFVICKVCIPHAADKGELPGFSFPSAESRPKLAQPRSSACRDISGCASAWPRTRRTA